MAKTFSSFEALGDSRLSKEDLHHREAKKKERMRQQDAILNISSIPLDKDSPGNTELSDQEYEARHPYNDPGKAQAQQAKIRTHIEELYQGAARKFIIHLIYNFIPAYKVELMYKYPTAKKAVCAITNRKLIGVGEAKWDKTTFKTLTEYTENSLESLMQGDFDMEDCESEKIIGKHLGYTGEKTSTFISHSALIALTHFTLEKYQQKDPFITKTINRIVKKGEIESKR